MTLSDLIALADARVQCRSVIIGSMPQLNAIGLHPCQGHGSPRYLPRLILAHALGEGFGRHDLTRAMRSLLAEGAIERVRVGSYPNRTPKFGLRSCARTRSVQTSENQLRPIASATQERAREINPRSI